MGVLFSLVSSEGGVCGGPGSKGYNATVPVVSKQFFKPEHRYLEIFPNDWRDG